MPAFGVMRLVDGSRTDGEFVRFAEQVDMSVDGALFVNSDYAVSNNGYGWCRSLNAGPFWVTPENISDVVTGGALGPVDSETYFSPSGSGYVAIYKDTSRNLVYCDVRGGQIMWDAELTGGLSAASDSSTGASTGGAKLLIPDPGTGDLMDGAAITITNRSLDATGLSGDYCIVARIADEWRLVWIDC
jgi:hypothetical protein